MSVIRWVCPHCDHAGIIDSAHSIKRGFVSSELDTTDDNWIVHVHFLACPNPDCGLTTIQIAYGNGVIQTGGHFRWTANATSLRLRPSTYSRPMPEYVPAAIREDYQEACSILERSPKAAATLARRALQGMIRNFHGITRHTLAKEIEALRDIVDPLVWQAIDAVRRVGNIGAHMERDIDLIVEVEPDEALKLVRLIELLVKEWYIARHEREQELAAIIALNVDKQEQRKPVEKTSDVETEDASNS